MRRFAEGAIGAKSEGGVKVWAVGDWKCGSCAWITRRRGGYGDGVGEEFARLRFEGLGNERY